MSLYITAVVDAVQEHLRGLWSEGRGWSLLIISAGWLLLMGVRLVYPAILPFIRAEFGLSLTVSGALLTSLWIAYAIGQLPGGLLGDWIGEGNVLLLSGVVSTLTVLAIAISVDLWMVFGGVVAFGLASALYSPARFTIYTNIYPERAGSAVGFTMAAGSVGNTILPVAAVVIATHLAWRLSFGVLVPFFVLVTIGLWLIIPSRVSDGSDGTDEDFGETARRIVTAIRSGGIPIVAGINVLMSLIYQGFVSFYPTYLIEVKGFDAGLAATFFGLFFAISIFVQLFAGSLRDWLGTKWSLLIIIGLTSLGLWLLPFVHGEWFLVPVTVVLGSLSGYGVVTQTFIADALPAGITNSGLGILRTAFILIGAASPLLIGTLGEYGLLIEAFGGLAVLGTTAAVLSFAYL